jgi:hypothetical protein
VTHGGPIGLIFFTTGSEENPGQTSSFGCPRRLNIYSSVIAAKMESGTDLVDLINLPTTREQGFFLHQFRKDAADGPHIHRCRIFLRS